MLDIYYFFIFKEYCINTFGIHFPFEIIKFIIITFQHISYKFIKHHIHKPLYYSYEQIDTLCIKIGRPNNSRIFEFGYEDQRTKIINSLVINTSKFELHGGILPEHPRISQMDKETKKLSDIQREYLKIHLRDLYSLYNEHVQLKKFLTMIDTFATSIETKRFLFNNNADVYTYLPCVQRINKDDFCIMKLIFETVNNIRTPITQIYDVDKYKSERLRVTNISDFEKYLSYNTLISLHFKMRIEVMTNKMTYTTALKIIQIGRWKKPTFKFCVDFDSR